MSRRTTLSFVLSLAAASAAMAQGPAYNRLLVPSQITAEPSPSGAGYVVSGEVHIDGDGSVSGDLGCVVRAYANGAPIGAPVPMGIIIAGGQRSCHSFCFTCQVQGGFCLDFQYFCVCFTRNNDNGTPPSARFAFDSPDLKPGDVVTLRIEAADGALDEIVTSDDQAEVRIGDHACRADFSGDGVLNSQDFFQFLAAFFQGSADADFNGDGSTNSQDFFDFVGAFFAGC